MRSFKHVLIGLLSVAFVSGTLELGLPQTSQAASKKHGSVVKNIVKKLFPPCGPGTRKQRFVVSKDGLSVCDNKTGLWWEQSPRRVLLIWQEAIDHCANLTTSGKTWRLPTVEEIQWNSLIDYRVPDQAAALNAPNGPFTKVRSDFYWSATEQVDAFPPGAWTVHFGFGAVGLGLQNGGFLVWCVSGGQDGHAH